MRHPIVIVDAYVVQVSGGPRNVTSMDIHTQSALNIKLKCIMQFIGIHFLFFNDWWMFFLVINTLCWKYVVVLYAGLMQHVPSQENKFDIRLEERLHSPNIFAFQRQAINIVLASNKMEGARPRMLY